MYLWIYGLSKFRISGKIDAIAEIEVLDFLIDILVREQQDRLLRRWLPC